MWVAWTVVNNAVSFDLPLQVLEPLNDPQLYDSGLDTNQLMASFCPRAPAYPGTAAKPPASQ